MCLSVNGKKFSNTTFLSVLFVGGPSAALFWTDIVPLTSRYPSLQSHKPDLKIEVLNLIWLLVLHVPLASSLISTQLFVPNSVD